MNRCEATYRDVDGFNHWCCRADGHPGRHWAHSDQAAASWTEGQADILHASLGGWER